MKGKTKLISWDEIESRFFQFIEDLPAPLSAVEDIGEIRGSRTLRPYYRNEVNLITRRRVFLVILKQCHISNGNARFRESFSAADSEHTDEKRSRASIRKSSSSEKRRFDPCQ
jgi:hypothetical protein